MGDRRIFCIDFLEGVSAEEVELVVASDGGAIDDDIALRPLVTLHCVDANIEQLGNMQGFEFAAYHTDLIAVGHDDTNGLIGIEARAVFLINLQQLRCNNACLIGVHLVGKGPTPALPRREGECPTPIFFSWKRGGDEAQARL